MQSGMGSNLREERRSGNARGGRYVRSAVALGGQYRKFFGASVAAVLLLQITIVTDTIIVGELLGPVPMSGIRVASPIVNLLNVIAMLVGVGSATLVSIAIGRRDKATSTRLKGAAEKSGRHSKGSHNTQRPIRHSTACSVAAAARGVVRQSARFAIAAGTTASATCWTHGRTCVR